MTINHEELRKLANDGVSLDWRGTLALLDEIDALKRDHAEEIALIDKLVTGK